MLNKIWLAGLTLSLGLTSGCATNNATPLQNGPDSTTAQYQQRTSSSEAGNAGFSNSSTTILPATQQALAVTAAETMATPGSDAGKGAGDYLIGPEDLLEIRVFGVDDLSRTVRVSSRGLISLPLLGEVKAAGLTSSELETRLAELFGKDYLQNPQVGVFIKEHTSRRVTVDGAVNKPGVYPLKGRTTLLQAIALAEGLSSKIPASDLVRVFRNQPSGDKLTLEFNLSDIHNGLKPDPIVQGDDIITVQKNTTLYVIKDVLDTLRGFFIPFAIYR